MAIELLSVSVPKQLVQGTIYATPVRACHMFAVQTSADGTGATLNISNDSAMVTAVSQTTPAHITVAAAFIRAQTGTPIVTFKPF